jgi:hypothetical protein
VIFVNEGKAWPCRKNSIYSTGARDLFFIWWGYPDLPNGEDAIVGEAIGGFLI